MAPPNRLVSKAFAAVTLLAVLTFAPASLAQQDVPRGSGALDRGNPRVEAELLFDVTQAAPGEAFRVGVLFQMAPRWHIYWRNPGEAGLASEVELAGGGAEYSPLRFPFPETFTTDDGFITTYGYSGEVLLFSDARVGPDAQGALRVEADVDVLACEIACIPARLKLARTLPIGATRTPDARVNDLFDETAARVPQKLEGDVQPVRAIVEGQLEPGKDLSGVVELADGWKPGAAEHFFVPDESSALREPKFERQGDGRLRIQAELMERAARLKGVAHLRAPDGATRWVEIDVPFVEGTVKPAAGVVPAGGPSLAWVLLLAFLGGALLNLMPCVFPVLALKAYGFARTAHEDRRATLAHAGAFTAGVVGSMLVLAAVVSVAKVGGASVGWGFQFQEPLFVAAIGAVVVAFALNLFGVFNVGIGANAMVARVDSSQGLSRSVGEGVLAVLLATPCSAPLLGTAVGFAFAAGTATTFAVLAVLGLGLAAPFCLLVLIPGLGKLLPKPGAWMERLKQLLGFALFATAAWLLWVMGGLTGVDGMGRLAGFFVAVALACWLFGLSQTAAASRRWITLAVSVVVLAAAALTLLRFPDPLDGATRAPVAGTQSWSDEAVSAALAEGRPVFVDFTADWCLTCKFNERTVIASERVQAAFARHRVAFLVADWTRRDERIRAKLAEFGRAGVPMYLVIGPDEPGAPTVLPELLTEALVLEAIERAAPDVAADARPPSSNAVPVRKGSAP